MVASIVTMDTKLRSAVDELMSNTEVAGVVVSDPSGLCMVAEGCGKREHSGRYTSIYGNALSLQGTEGGDPSGTRVVIEGAQRTHIITGNGGMENDEGDDWSNTAAVVIEKK
eukprot:Clim_evm14s166 gene=Clim_evmTU14s166